MIWFRQNRTLGILAVALVLATIGSLAFLFSARSGWSEASDRFQQDAGELDRLQRLAPLPSAENLRKMKAHAEDYAGAVGKLKEELKARVLPVAPLAPNEFQARLRTAVTSMAEKARGAKTKLPENFFLGFDEFASTLPNTAAAPLLGQQLAQSEMLLNIVLDARVDSVSGWRRSALAQESGAPTASPSPAAAASGKPTAVGPKPVERSVIDLTFNSTPAAARRVLNAIAAADHQFFIVRLLHVRNEKEKGPARDVAVDAASNASGVPTGAAKPAAPALNFIVGNEHIQTSARIEIVRFNF